MVCFFSLEMLLSTTSCQMFPNQFNSLHLICQTPITYITFYNNGLACVTACSLSTNRWTVVHFPSSSTSLLLFWYFMQECMIMNLQPVSTE